jgi:hypothetical protein
MQRILILLALVAGPAAAQDGASLNRCWGDIASDVGSAGLMGEHSSAHSPFTPDPGEGGRRGVGNVSKEDFGPLSEGGQGQHAITNGERLEAVEEGEFRCDDIDMLDSLLGAE